MPGRTLPRTATCPAAPAPGAERCLVRFAEFALALRELDPPPAYRLSVDSGIEYRNVRNALQRPGSVRLQTWARLLASLGVELLAVPCARSGEGWPVTAIRPLAPGAFGILRAVQGLGRRGVARRAGIGVDAIEDLEAGRGLARSLERACIGLGWELAVALAPGQRTVGEMWERRAGQLLVSRARPSHRRRISPAAGPR